MKTMLIILEVIYQLVEREQKPIRASAGGQNRIPGPLLFNNFINELLYLS